MICNGYSHIYIKTSTVYVYRHSGVILCRSNSAYSAHEYVVYKAQLCVDFSPTSSSFVRESVPKPEP